ncbi:serine hydrolase domain-containing protein [Thermodesulfobacteriota bacterium]
MKKSYDISIKGFLDRGVKKGVYPGAVLLIAKGSRIIFFREVGYLSLIPEQFPMRKDSIFDLASLTKPLATTLALMKLVDEDKVNLDQPLSGIITTSPLLDKKDLTLRLIMSHSAGFVDWQPYYLDLMKYRPDERKKLLRERIVKEPLAYRPGKNCIYSDLGFMILEWIVEEVSGMPLHYYTKQNFYRSLSLERTFLNAKTLPAGLKKGEIAATEDCPWRNRIIQGEVHDENAYVVGGYSGHAGLFSNAQEVYIIAKMLKEHYHEERDDYFKSATVKAFFKRQGVVNGCSWALGWDTPSDRDSSSGRYLSPNSVGHLGFAGTSIWMDLDRDIMIIFLTNRVHPSRNNQKIKQFRPALHDLIIVEICEGQVN